VEVAWVVGVADGATVEVEVGAVVGVGGGMVAVGGRGVAVGLSPQAAISSAATAMSIRLSSRDKGEAYKERIRIRPFCKKWNSKYCTR
jgi:hypothetical protein